MDDPKTTLFSNVELRGSTVRWWLAILYHKLTLTVWNILQFIDLCILLGCDYCDSIKGIGPKKAVELINKHKCIEKIIENLDKSVRVHAIYFRFY